MFGLFYIKTEYLNLPCHKAKHQNKVGCMSRA
nr:MAG TPA: hypothetical protein [Caudoviricetes sp.]